MPKKVNHTEEELREIASRLTLQYIKIYHNNNVKVPEQYAEYYLKVEKEIYEKLVSQS